MRGITRREKGMCILFVCVCLIVLAELVSRTL